MKRCLAAVCAAVCCAVFSGCGNSEEALQLPKSGVTIDGAAVPYVRQDGRTYLYLKDLEENGFYRDYAGFGLRPLSEDLAGYYFALWTNDCHRERKPEEKNTEPPTLMPDAQNEIYINGLQITCYALEGEPLVDAEELAGIAVDSSVQMEGVKDGTAVYYDAEGNAEELTGEVVCISQMTFQTLDGEPETADCFQFENCSGYLATGKASEDHSRIALHVFQKGEMLETAKGDFPLDGIYAGQSGGIRAIEMTDGYAQFSNALERMGLSYSMDSGKLQIEGEGDRKVCHIDQPEAIQYSPYFHMRFIKTRLKMDGAKTVECLYSGNSLYVSREDVETKQLLKKNGYRYKNYAFWPI